MKPTISKFLIIGAMTLGFTVNSLASSDDIKSNVQDKVKETITANVQKSIQLQIDKGFLTEQPELKVVIIPYFKTAQQLLVEKTQKNSLHNEHDSSNSLLDEHEEFNSASRGNHKCNVTLVFDNKGNIPGLVEDIHAEDLLKVTQFENETQRSIAREFVSLHESFHCEFSSIENPVVVPGKDTKFNQEISYLFKDQFSSLGFGFGKLAYIDALNENFADTAAALALVKEYGADNKNLQFVLNALQAQRHGTYFHNSLEPHFTHFSLEQILKPNVLKRLETVNDNASFKQLALIISNYGTQQAMSHRQDMADGATAVNAVDFAIAIHLTRLIRYQFLSEEVKKTASNNPWREGVSRGIAFDIAATTLGNQNFTSQEFYKPDGTMGKDYPKFQAVLSKLMSSLKMTPTRLVAYQGFEEYLEEFKQAALKPVNQNDFDFMPQRLSEENLNQKIKQLRADFIEKKNNSQLSIN